MKNILAVSLSAFAIVSGITTATTAAFALDAGIYTLQQASSLRFMDAHESAGNDFDVVTRETEANNTQKWLILPVPGTADRYTIQQLSNFRFLDAHESNANDFRAVTRPARRIPILNGQINDQIFDRSEALVPDQTQRWIITELRNGDYRIQQESTRRFLDAHEFANNDFSIVTRDFEANSTQEWILLE